MTIDEWVVATGRSLLVRIEATKFGAGFTVANTTSEGLPLAGWSWEDSAMGCEGCGSTLDAAFQDFVNFVNER